MSGGFCVLLPVYAGDRAEHFARAVRSVARDQTRRPDRVVIVCDGPVGAPLERILRDCAERRRSDLLAGVPARLVRLPRNRGLARALDVGLSHCDTDIVARADADDISLPQRFARQVPPVEDGLDLVGCAIQEFEDDESRPGLVRRMPTGAAEIRRIARFRDPFNHPSVVYRAAAVRRAGGYQELARMEDYWLFARMLAAGARVANLAEPLVLYRVGAGAYDRRGGAAMLRSEVVLQWRMVRSRFTTPAQFGRNLAVRGGYRLLPAVVRRALYHGVGRRSWFGSARRVPPRGAGGGVR